MHIGKKSHYFPLPKVQILPIKCKSKVQFWHLASELIHLLKSAVDGVL